MENDAPAGTPPAGTRPGLRWALTALAATVLVVALAAIVYLAVDVRPRAEAAETEEQSRAEVTRAAERFVVRFNTYDAGSVDEYAASLRDLLSPKFKASFDQDFEQASQLITQSKLRSEGEVLASGVASVDPDSARVLVVADADASSAVEGKVQRHFRWAVSLVSIDGEWLVDDYRPVTQ
jgi:Mce-associated membrane protein